MVSLIDRELALVLVMGQSAITRTNGYLVHWSVYVSPQVWSVCHPFIHYMKEMKEWTWFISLCSIAITKLDILDGMTEVKIGVAYCKDGKKLEYFPGEPLEIAWMHLRSTTRDALFPW